MSVKKKRNLAQQIILMIALLVTVSVAGILVSMIVRSESEPAKIAITPLSEPVVSGEGAWQVAAEVTNKGDSPAEGIHLSASLIAGGSVSEESELTLTFLPRRSKRVVYFVFARDPSCCEIRLRVTGYEEP